MSAMIQQRNRSGISLQETFERVASGSDFTRLFYQISNGFGKGAGDYSSMKCRNLNQRAIQMWVII
jgi:hypothetical protein